MRSLRRRGASRNVLRCAALFKCDACLERRRPDPRHQATLSEIVPKWHILQCDAGTWTHPENGLKYQIMVGVDEGCRLRVAKLLFQHQSRTPGTEDFIGFLEEQWFPYFGKPSVIRLDPAGCFRRNKLDQYLSERQITLQHIPAEAHWQLALAERAIASTKAVMTALISGQPEMHVTEALSRSVWAANHRDVYRGYSPLQHAYGRAPDDTGRLGENCLRDTRILTENGISAEFGSDVQAMHVAERTFLEEQARERLQRAVASGNRPMRHFAPGDLVYVWRRMKPKHEGVRPFRTGKFIGPCRILPLKPGLREEKSGLAVLFGCIEGVTSLRRHRSSSGQLVPGKRHGKTSRTQLRFPGLSTRPWNVTLPIPMRTWRVKRNTCPKTLGRKRLP